MAYTPNVWNIGDVITAALMNHLETQYDEAIADMTKEFFIPTHYGGGGATEVILGDYHGFLLDAAAEFVYHQFRIPIDFATLTHIKAVMITNTDGLTGGFDWTVATDFAADGEAYNIHSDTDTANDEPCEPGEILEVDISDAFTNLAAGDAVGAKFTLDALGTDNGYVQCFLGLNIKYS